MLKFYNYDKVRNVIQQKNSTKKIIKTEIYENYQIMRTNMYAKAFEYI